MNEVVKCYKKTLITVMHYILNKIIKGQSYQKWSRNIITPIHKSGDMNNPTNYRGIAVSDELNKVFTKKLNTRINNYLTLKGFWSPNQHGFMKGCRTEDSAFIIQTL